MSRLLDAEERGSASSAQESSSVEQEADSDEDGVQGPNKRRDQRLSKATRALLSGQQPDSTHRRLLALSIAEHATRESKSFISISETTVAPSSSPLHPSSPPQSSSIPCTPSIKAELFNDTDDPETGIEQSDTDDSDWIPEPSRPSSRASVSSPTRSGGIRLKLYPRPVDASPSIGIVACRTMQKQLGPQHHRLTSRDRKDMKKAAQKIARKQRAQAEAAAKSKQVDIIKNSTSALPILSNGRVMQSPFIESGIKTLYI